MFLMFLMLIIVNFYEIGEHSDAAEVNFNSVDDEEADGKDGE